MERASNLRMIALASVVALAAMLPLAAATAGPAGPAGRKGGEDDRKSSARTNTPEALPTLSACGPQLSSPDGLTAQTCTISESGDTWARTYYRNTTGEALTGVLSLMRPDGSTVEVDCPVGTGKRSGVCETPHGPTVAGRSYDAVAEFAQEGQEDTARVLLRAGSAVAED